MMNGVFTQHAIDQMHTADFDRADIDGLLGLLDRVAATSGGLDDSPNVTLVRRNGDGAMYIARAGSLRAVLITGATEDGFVVVNVYRRDAGVGSFFTGAREASARARAG